MNLTRASKELFRRTPDEFFPSLGHLSQYCHWQKDESQEVWQPPEGNRHPGDRPRPLDALRRRRPDLPDERLEFQSALPAWQASPRKP